MKRVAFLALTDAFNLNAQNKNQQDQDQDARKERYGCFDVTFSFAETFESSKDLTYVPSITTHDDALQLAILLEDPVNKIVIQYVARPSANRVVVRTKRNDIFSRNENLNLNEKVNNKELFKYLSEEKGY